MEKDCIFSFTNYYNLALPSIRSEATHHNYFTRTCDFFTKEVILLFIPHYGYYKNLKISFTFNIIVKLWQNYNIISKKLRASRSCYLVH